MLYVQLLGATLISAFITAAGFSWMDRNLTQAGGAEDSPNWFSVAAFLWMTLLIGGPTFWLIQKLTVLLVR